MERVRLGRALGVVAVTAVAVLGSVSSASALASGALGIEAKSPGTLRAKGAAVTVPVDIVCTGDAFVSVLITQRVSAKSVAQGDTDVIGATACTGDVQRVSVTLAASGAAFRKGAALVHAEISGCFGDVCGTAVNDASIDVVPASK